MRICRVVLVLQPASVIDTKSLYAHDWAKKIRYMHFVAYSAFNGTNNALIEIQVVSFERDLGLHDAYLLAKSEVVRSWREANLLATPDPYVANKVRGRHRLVVLTGLAALLTPMHQLSQSTDMISNVQSMAEDCHNV